MFTKTMFALAFALATASGALAATKSQSTNQGQNVYNPRGAYVGTDPDLNVRFELKRDSDRGY
jgi:citrate synthase